MGLSIESLKNALQTQKIRPSYHRIKVLEYLHQKQGHPTADDIFAFLSPDIPSLSKATIYNTLNLFLEVGMVRLISIDGIEKRYDITLHNHGHFQCDGCNAIVNFKIDIDSVPFAHLEQFEIRGKNVYFNGLCPRCLSQQKAKKE